MLTVSNTHHDFLRNLNGQITIMHPSQTGRSLDPCYALALRKVALRLIWIPV